MKKNLSIFIIVVLVFSLVVGCSKTTVTPESTPKPSASTTIENSDTPPSDLLTEILLPIVQEPIELEVFIEIDASKIGAHTNNYNDLLAYQELTRLTNINLKFLHPPTGQATEQFNLMLSAGDLPDIVYWNFLNVPGGPNGAIEDGLILDLTEYYEKYSPNLTSFLNENPEVRKEISTDDGTYYCYPYIQHDQIVNNSFGYMVRADWLDKLDIEKPVTIDDWYNMLVSFRDNDPNENGKKDEIPLIARGALDVDSALSHLSGAWGIDYEYYQENNKVHYGPYEPQFKEFLKVMRKWIEEGLVDPDFASQDQQLHDAKFLDSRGGIVREGLGSGMDRYIMGLGGDESLLTWLDFPVMTAGEKPKNFQGRNTSYAFNGASISATSEYAKEAAQWLDFHYSEQGSMILNFGVEGQTYDWVDGYPLLSEEIRKSDLGVSVALGKYAPGASWEAFLQDARVREQRLLKWPVQREACDIWNASDTSGMMPPISTNLDESTQFSNVMSEADTYVREKSLAYLLGKEDIDNTWDKYLSTLKKMGIEDAIAIQQAALDRYNQR